jgi:hypothetical protein
MKIVIVWVDWPIKRYLWRVKGSVSKSLKIHLAHFPFLHLNYTLIYNVAVYFYKHVFF